MPAGKQADKYDQFMTLAVQMSAANTLTFSRVGVGVSIFDYAAFIISRIEYHLAATGLDPYDDSADSAEVALTGNDQITTLSVEQPEVYDALVFGVRANAAPATSEFVYFPVVHDFSTLSGGGLIVPAQDMYVGMTTTGLAAAAYARLRVYYRILALQAADYIELVQRLRVIRT